MPKASRKKRKNENEEDIDKNKTKCLKGKKEKDERGECDSEEELRIVDPSTSVDETIEDSLERNATKNNLSAFNVKSIIHHVLSDERVLAMACKAAEKEEPRPDIILDDQCDDHINDIDHDFQINHAIIEPKLTRSRFREVSQVTGEADPIALVKKAIIGSPLKKIVSPLKSKSPFKRQEINVPVHEDLVKVPLAEIKFSEEGSSDEEYDPSKEDWNESGDDSESNLSATSDLASPEPLRRTPRVKRKLLTDNETSPVAKKTTTNKPVSEGDESSPFKIPLAPTTKKQQDVKNDLIASRTRSRLPLNDTDLNDLEADFLLPDVTPDMYDWINLDELDSEDLYWHKWLSGLTKEKVPTDNEDVEDTEYNFMGDVEKEEKEEYRNDRAVKISQKELSELLSEFLCEVDNEAGAPRQVVVPSGDIPLLKHSPMPEKQRILNYDQRTLLITQLQQHTQLLVQMYFLSREQSSLLNEANTCCRLIEDLFKIKESIAINTSSTVSSVWSYVALDDAVRVINSPSSVSLPKLKLPCNKQVPNTCNVPILPKADSDFDHSLERGPAIPESLAKLFWVSPIFIFNGLLPMVGFRSRQQAKGKTRKFLQSEDNLLVLGMDQFGPNWKLIRDHYLPSKTEEQIRIRRKNLCSKRAPDNVMKQFKKTGKLPPLPLTVCHRGDYLIRPDDELASEVKIKKKRICSRRKKNTNDSSQKKTLSPLEIKPLPPIVIKPQPESVPKNNKVISLKALPAQETTVPPQKSTIRIAPRPEKVVKVEPIKEIKPIEMPKMVEKFHVNDSEASKEQMSPENNPPSEAKENPPSTLEPTSVTNKQENTSTSNKVEKADGVISEERFLNGHTDTTNEIKIRDRAFSFAQSYLNNVKKCLEKQNQIYDSFLDMLLKSRTENWTAITLYKEVSVVLKDFPALVRDFVGFLEPEQAFEIGMYMPNNEVMKARSFLCKVENHFLKNPAQFQKIVKAFTTYNFTDPKPEQLYETIVPLLKGQQPLIDEFNTFFGHRPPPYSYSDEFEDIEIRSDSEFEFDGFEEVSVTDVPLRYVRKSDESCLSPRPAMRWHRIRKEPNYDTTLARKDGKSIQNDDESKAGSLDDMDSTQDGMNEDYEEHLKYIEESYATSEDTCDKKSQDSDSECYNMDDDVDDVDSAGDHDSAVTSPKASSSDHSNGSSPISGDDMYLEQNIESPVTQDGQISSSSDSCISEPTSPNSSLGLGNDSCETTRDSLLSSQLESERVHTDSTQSVRSVERLEGDCEKEQRITGNEKKKETNDGSYRISANNLELDKDGRPLIVWERHEDKMILELYRTSLTSEDVFSEIAKVLNNRTAEQVKGRFRVLVSLMANTDTNEDDFSSEESGSELEDTEEVVNEI